MQPTEQQVQRSLAALRNAERELARRPIPALTDSVIAGVVLSTSNELPDGVRQRVDAAPSLRVERLEAARRWLAEGCQTSAEELAERMVGRLVCDRLR